MNRTLTIRNAQQNDSDSLSELAILTYTDAFGHTFSETDLAAHLQKHLSPSNFARILKEEVVLLAELEGQLIGYVQFGAVDSASPHPTDQELRRLYVLSEFQNQGVGNALMETALSHPHMSRAANIYLDVWEHNPGAQRLYRSYGFEVVGAHTFETESGAEDGLELIMVRPASKKGSDH